MILWRDDEDPHHNPDRTNVVIGALTIIGTLLFIAAAIYYGVAA